VAQGIAGALYEMLPYDTNGQPLATSFMDYVIPSATDVPHLIIEHMESLAPEMPFGIKGVGEGGAIGPPATIAGAVVDALSEFGIDITETPITPGLILRLLRAKSLSVEGASS
jgi:carbon-monoxide dehydrogenase large subunit